jgi:uncharacterized membrane protein YkvA (DUF1232 family)
LSHAKALKLGEKMRADLTPAEVLALAHDVRAHFDALVAAQKRSELIAIDLAELLADRLSQLLGIADDMPPAHRAAVVGAARYFISEEDAIPDHNALTGLDDDVAVFNAAAREIGRKDLVIDD